MPSHKISSVHKLAQKVRELKKVGKRIIHCHGCFDLMHPGHIRYLESAKKLGDVLVVTVTQDKYVDKGPDRPVFNEEIRVESLASLEVVDYVALNEWATAEETLRLIRPDYYVKGQEFEGKEDVTGKLQREIAVVKEIGAEIRYTHDIVFSSSELLNNHFSVFSEDLKAFLLSFKKKYTGADIDNILNDIKNMKILVIGDAIIDDYHFCIPMNKSTKATAITSQYLSEEAGIGGGLCIANHLSSFCDHVTLISCFGSRDHYLEFCKEKLDENVNLLPFVREDAFTTLKRRYIDKTFYHKIFEIHFFDDSPCEPYIEEAICAYLKENASEFDLMIVADFGHGLMTTGIINTICQLDIFLALTVQTNSNNFGFNYVTKYPRADYIAIDEREVRLACQDRLSPLETLTNRLSQQLKCKQFAVTLGRDGSMIKNNGDYLKVPIVTKQVVDTIGSGDAFLALSAPIAAMNESADLLLFFGNVAGAMAANVVGNNEAIKSSEFRNFVRTLMK